MVRCVGFAIQHTPLLGFAIRFDVKMALEKVNNSLLQSDYSILLGFNSEKVMTFSKSIQKSHILAG